MGAFGNLQEMIKIKTRGRYKTAPVGSDFQPFFSSGTHFFKLITLKTNLLRQTDSWFQLLWKLF